MPEKVKVDVPKMPINHAITGLFWMASSEKCSMKFQSIALIIQKSL